MFLVGELGATIDADQKPFDRTLDNVFRDGGRKMRRLGSQMTAALTLPLAGAGTMAVKTAAEYEQLEVQLSNLVGSAEEGARIFEQLQEFAAGTPFRLKNIVEANNQLIGMGMSAEQAFENVELLGNVASATGADLKGLAQVMGESSAEGRLMTRDIRQFISRGVPAVKLLADSMNVAKDEIFDLAEQGKISFDDLQQAIIDVAGEGGEWANATEDQANTIAGVWSTLRDNVDKALGELGETIVETLDLKQLVRDLTANIQTITERFAGLSEDSQKQILKMAGLFMAGGPILIGLGQAAIAISAFSKFVRTRFAAITAGVALFAGAVEQVEDRLVNAFGNSKREIKSFTQSAKDRLGRLIAPIIEFTEESLGAGDALEKLQNLLNNLTGGGLTEVNQVLKDTRDILSFINGDINALNDGLQEVFNMDAPEVDRSWRESIFETKNAVDDLGESIGEMPEIEINDDGMKAATGSIDDLQMKMRAYTNMQRKMDPDSAGFDILGESIRAANRQMEVLTSKMKLSRGELLDYSGTAQMLFEDIKLGAQAAFGVVLDESTRAFGEALFKAQEYNMADLKLRKNNLKQQEQELRDSLANQEIAQQEFNLRLQSLYNQQAEIESKMAKAREGIFKRSMRALVNAAASAVKQILAEFAKIAFIKGLSALLGFGGVSTAGGFASELFGSIFGGNRASGGPVTAGQSYVVGESGREMFVPTTDGNIMPIDSGGGSMDSGNLAKAIGRELDRRLQKLGPDEIFAMNAKGGKGY